MAVGAFVRHHLLGMQALPSPPKECVHGAMKPGAKIRVGLLLDGRGFPRDVLDFLLLAAEATNYEISAIIWQHTARWPQNLVKKTLTYIQVRGLRLFLRNTTFRILELIEGLIASTEPHPFSTGSPPDWVSKITHVHVSPEVSTTKYVETFSPKDIEKVQSLNLDILVRGRAGILRGDILNACRGGILSFHHGDNKVNRGGPAGFWEVFEKTASTGYIIQTLGDELDGGGVVAQGRIQTQWLYTLNRDKVLRQAVPAMHRVLETFAKDGVLKIIDEPQPYYFPLRRTPTIPQQSRYVLSTLIRLGGKVLGRLFPQTTGWRIAYQFTGDWKSSVLWKSKKIANPPGRFFADPFLWEMDGVNYCFIEDYSHKEKKAVISVLEISQEGHRYVGTALEEPFHLSFPFVFEFDNQIFMCPETTELEEVRIYRATNFPLQWEFERTILDGISAADSIIFPRDGRWWLLTTVMAPGGDHNSEIHLFSSANPLEDVWEPAETNPLFVDSERARNAGLISSNGELVRCFQSQGFDLYGHQVGFAQIEECSAKKYSERLLFSIGPDFFPDASGVHTFSQVHGLVAFDYFVSRWR